MNGFEKSVGWSEEHSFRANHLKRKRKERKRERKKERETNVFIKKRTSTERLRKLKSSFTLEWRSSRTCLLSLPLGFFFFRF